MTKEYILTDKDKELLIELYYADKKFEDIANTTGFPHRKIRSFYNENNMPLVKRYSFNSDYFESIDTKQKAYWLGYLYCDGFVGSGKYNNIVLSSIDKNVIDDFVQDLEFKGIIPTNIVVADDKRKSISFAKSDLYEVRFSNKTMKETLVKRNFIPHRKQLKFININDIPRKLLIYVLYGMWDADGYVSLTNGIGTKKIIHLYSSNELLAEYELLYKNLNIPYSIKRNEEKDCNYLRVLFEEIDSNIVEEYLIISKMYRKI